MGKEEGVSTLGAVEGIKKRSGKSRKIANSPDCWAGSTPTASGHPTSTEISTTNVQPLRTICSASNREKTWISLGKPHNNNNNKL